MCELEILISNSQWFILTKNEKAHMCQFLKKYFFNFVENKKKLQRNEISPWTTLLLAFSYLVFIHKNSKYEII